MDAQGSVLGIDVGWSENRRSSAVCRLSWDDRQIDWRVERFRANPSEREDAISRVADGRELLTVAIDGPLQPRLNVIGRYRSAERLLSRGDLRRRIGKPGQSSSPNGRKLNEQANEAAILVKRRCGIRKASHQVRIDEHSIVEAFPTTFLGVMVERPEELSYRRARSDRYFVHLAEHRCLDRFVQRVLGGRKWLNEPRHIRNHDDRAALVCALTALSVAAGEFTAVGDREDGWIILPPRWAFADWAWTATRKRALDERTVLEPASAGKLLSFSENQLCSTTSC